MLYLASWIARSAQLSRERDDQIRQVLVSIHGELQAAATARAAADAVVAAPLTAAAGSPPVGARPVAEDPTTEVPVVRPFVATPSGSMFHRPDCSVVATRADLRSVASTDPGVRPCGMCDPLGA